MNMATIPQVIEACSATTSTSGSGGGRGRGRPRARDKHDGGEHDTAKPYDWPDSDHDSVGENEDNITDMPENEEQVLGFTELEKPHAVTLFQFSKSQHLFFIFRQVVFMAINIIIK